MKSSLGPIDMRIKLSHILTFSYKWPTHFLQHDPTKQTPAQSLRDLTQGGQQSSLKKRWKSDLSTIKKVTSLALFEWGKQQLQQ